ncbi:MAG: BRO-N domain-containing protein [Sarcina sp.]
MKKIDLIKVLSSTLNVYEYKKEMYFSAQEVADMLDYSKANISKMVTNVDEDEKIKFCVHTESKSTKARNQHQWFLTEDGLHELLFQSKKPIAKEFKKEVKTILKLIKQNGYYIATEKDDKWMGVRQESIRARKEFTDEVQEFVHYALENGSKKPEKYYVHFTNLVNKKVGVPKGVKRCDLNQRNLRLIESYETILSVKLHKLTNLESMHYKEIYQEIKKLIEQI